VDVGERQRRRAERDHRGDEIRPPDTQNAGQVPAPAVPDEGRALSARPHERLESLLEPHHGAFATPDVHADAGVRRVIPGGLQPAHHRLHRQIGRQEPGDDEHRPPATVAHVLSPQNGIAAQPMELAPGHELAQHRGAAG
jgi:hypothetical protein